MVFFGHINAFAAIGRCRSNSRIVDDAPAPARRFSAFNPPPNSSATSRRRRRSWQGYAAAAVAVALVAGGLAGITGTDTLAFVVDILAAD
jgi:hypothetical protein